VQSMFQHVVSKLNINYLHTSCKETVLRHEIGSKARGHLTVRGL
jgi:hypothetical protein